MLKAGFAVETEGTEQLRARIAREVPMWKELVERAPVSKANKKRLNRKGRLQVRYFAATSAIPSDTGGLVTFHLLRLLLRKRAASFVGPSAERRSGPARSIAWPPAITSIAACSGGRMMSSGVWRARRCRHKAPSRSPAPCRQPPAVWEVLWHPFGFGDPRAQLICRLAAFWISVCTLLKFQSAPRRRGRARPLDPVLPCKWDVLHFCARRCGGNNSIAR